jgi:hypothetical protein
MLNTRSKGNSISDNYPSPHLKVAFLTGHKASQFTVFNMGTVTVFERQTHPTAFNLLVIQQACTGSSGETYRSIIIFVFNRNWIISN